MSRFLCIGIFFLGMSFGLQAKPADKKSSVSQSEVRKDFWDLTISWVTPVNFKSSVTNWKKACKQLAKNFKLNPKAGSQGVFKKVTCNNPVRVIDESKIKSDFHLVMKQDEKVSFDLYFKTGTTKKLSAHVDFGTTPKLLEAIQDESVSSLLAMVLLDQLPIRYAAILNSEANTKVNLPRQVSKVVTLHNEAIEAKKKDAVNDKKGKLNRSESTKEKKIKAKIKRF